MELSSPLGLFLILVSTIAYMTVGVVVNGLMIYFNWADDEPKPLIVLFWPLVLLVVVGVFTCFPVFAAPQALAAWLRNQRDERERMRELAKRPNNEQ